MDSPVTNVSSTASSRLERELAPQLDMFYAFAQRRVANPELARDLVHDALLKAVEREGEIAEEKLSAWIFRSLRNASIDAYRRRGAADRALEKLANGFVDQPTDEENRDLCQCFTPLLAKLKPAYADVLKRVDFDGVKLSAYAREKGRSENAMRVKLHRAREQMRAALKRACGACSKHGCLDCECE